MTVSGANDELILFPKYHCELNSIEQFWGRSKQELRRRETSYTKPQLCVAVAAVQNNVPLPLICRYSRTVFRFMDGYRKGLTGEAASKIVKRHRRNTIPGGMLSQFEGS